MVAASSGEPSSMAPSTCCWEMARPRLRCFCKDSTSCARVGVSSPKALTPIFSAPFLANVKLAVPMTTPAMVAPRCALTPAAVTSPSAGKAKNTAPKATTAPMAQTAVLKLRCVSLRFSASLKPWWFSAALRRSSTVSWAGLISSSAPTSLAKERVRRFSCRSCSRSFS